MMNNDCQQIDCSALISGLKSCNINFDFSKWLPYIPFFFIWFVVLLPKAIQLVFYLVILMLLFIYRLSNATMRIKFDGFSFCLLGMVAVQMLAILFNVQYAGTSRVFAAANTVLIWITSIGMYSIYRTVEIDQLTISKAAALNLVILTLLAVVSKFTDFSVSFFGDVRQLNVMNWFNGTKGTRFLGFLEYSNLVTFMYLLFLPLSLLYLKKISSLILQLAFCFITTFPVIAASSRSGMLLSFAVLLVSMVYLLSSKFGKPFYKIVLVSACILAILLFINSDLVLKILLEVLKGRPGSNTTRSLVYELSIKTVFERSPFIGMGVKLIDPALGNSIPLGSHSTYIGILYKSGLIGLVLLLMAVISYIRTLVRSINSSFPSTYLLLYIIIFGIFLAVEDIDGANWALATTMMIAGVIMYNSTHAAKMG